MSVAYAVVFCLAFTAAVLSAPLVRLLAVRIGAVDMPDGKRKIHSKPMPRLGGLVITIAIGLAVSLYFLMTPSAKDSVLGATTPYKIIGFALGFLIILGLGIWDDIKGVKPRTKILFQTVAVLVCFAVGFRADLPFFGRDNIWISLPVTWFWLVACINAMNLVDGMDGLASGVAFFVTLVIFVLAAFYSKIAVALVAAALLGSVVGFLMYNFHPAVMFLGDSGSMLLGYSIAILAIAGSLRSHATVAMLIPILALGLPIMDTLLAIIRRWSRRLPVSQADREHVHHKLLAMGFSHKEAVIVLYGTCLTLAAGALAVASRSDLAVGLVLGILCLAGVAAVRIVGAGEIVGFMRRVGETLRANRHERQRAAERNAAFWLNQSASLDDVRKVLEAYVNSLHAAEAIIYAENVAGNVLLEVSGSCCEVAGQGASREEVLALPSGKKIVLVVKGRGLEGVEFPEELKAALTRVLGEMEKLGRQSKSGEARGIREGFAAP